MKDVLALQSATVFRTVRLTPRSPQTAVKPRGRHPARDERHATLQSRWGASRWLNDSTASRTRPRCRCVPSTSSNLIRRLGTCPLSGCSSRPRRVGGPCVQGSPSTPQAPERCCLITTAASRHRPEAQAFRAWIIARVAGTHRRAGALAHRQLLAIWRTSHLETSRQLGDGAARRLRLRHDHGANSLADDFQEEIAFFGIERSPS